MRETTAGGIATGVCPRSRTRMSKQSVASIETKRHELFRLGRSRTSGREFIALVLELAETSPHQTPFGLHADAHYREFPVESAALFEKYRRVFDSASLREQVALAVSMTEVAGAFLFADWRPLGEQRSFAESVFPVRVGDDRWLDRYLEAARVFLSERHSPMAWAAVPDVIIATIAWKIACLQLYPMAERFVQFAERLCVGGESPMFAAVSLARRSARCCRKSPRRGCPSIRTSHPHRRGGRMGGR